MSLDSQQSSTETSLTQDGRNRSSWLEQSSAVFTVLLGIVAVGTTDYTLQGKVLIGAAIASAIVAAVLPTFIVPPSAKAFQRVLLVITTMLVAVLVSSTFLRWPLIIVMQGHEGYARFDSPDNGEEVSSLVTLTGEADVAEDTSLWLLIQPPDNRWYTTNTSPVHVDRSGRWQVQDVGVGKGEASVGRSFAFFLVAVPKDDDPVQKALDSKRLKDLESNEKPRMSVGFDSLPGQDLDVVQVTLGNASSALTGTFTAPRQWDRVPLPTERRVTGTLSARLREGHSLWVAQRTTEEELFHPQDVACDVSGRQFECPQLYLGVPQDRARVFDIYLWSADQASTSVLQKHGSRPSGDYAGIDRPAGAEQIGHISVVRD